MKFANSDLNGVLFDYHPSFIRQAKDGDVKSAQILLLNAIVCIENRLPIPEPLASYMAEALWFASRPGERLGMTAAKLGARDGMTADEASARLGMTAAELDARLKMTVAEAFNLTRKRGRNKYDEASKAELICCEVRLAWKKERRFETSGKGPGAFQIVGERYDKSPRTIEKLWRKWKTNPNWRIEQQTEDELIDTIAAIKRVLYG